MLLGLMLFSIHLRAEGSIPSRSRPVAQFGRAAGWGTGSNPVHTSNVIAQLVEHMAFNHEDEADRF
jgi:hypothetical protein